MTLRGALVFATLSASIAGAQTPRAKSSAPHTLREYTVDFGHSIVEFSIGFAFSRVKGRFTSAKGTILYDDANPANSSVTMVIDAKSIDTGWPHRDEHLRTDDFFDVDKYPTIVFQSDRLAQTTEGWVANGQLTMHGVTRSVAIPFHFPRLPSRSPESGWMVLNADAALRLKRTDFAILGGSTHNAWFDKARAATMADSVDVSLEIEAYSPDAASQRSAGVDAVLQRIQANGVQSQIDRLTEAKRTRPAAAQAGLINGGDLVARGLIATGRIADALELSRALAELFPTETRAAAVYALALAISRDTAGAIREYARMKQIFRAPAPDPNERFPQDDETWYYLDQLARTTIEWRHPAEGMALARTVAELHPATARAHTTLGVLLAEMGDAKGAAAAYARALDVDPRETRALEWRRRL
ncbi:MAG TPA: YceI family protein [Gemmatimonadaceae bacterium]|jgi:polyisoprenoid-binding protein YceI|nr:YceI family protein [Gemmatimonadaceae bacterium]